MITSTLSTTQGVRPELPIPASKRLPPPLSPRFDQISLENAVSFRTELARHPEVRAEVVARARALAADATYPPVEAVRAVADQILRSRDLSEDLV